ncbi:helix-turn-helix protein [Nitrospirillum amazonense]|uniref:Helix-turn-helix protein n=1 Tax=Nitrospirillum amazonense TaxID=28077 RepID=A0A560EIN8_9PROT|nr:helix-turn-helix transcriptional regulator [Nitrospirillum amazonense]TWB09207.1 helix-turn-helix protein [Nitrospirillum amazonense]
MPAFTHREFWQMDFPERLAALRKGHGLTQQALADQVGIHVLQIRRYEGGTSQPTLDVIRRLARALRVSADELVFDKDERGPSDEFRIQFEAVSQLPEEDRKVVKALLDGMIVKHQAKRMVGSLSS